MCALRGIKFNKKVSCSTKVETERQGGRDRETIGETECEHRYITMCNKAEIMYCNSWGWDKGTEGKQKLETSAERNGIKEQGCARAGRRGKT